DLSTALRLGSIRSIREKLREFVSFFDSVDNKVMKEIEEFVPELYPLMQAMCKRYKKLDTGRRKIELDDKELKAEQELLKFYLETEDLGMALRLAREYMVNVKLHKEGRVEDVLNRRSRENVPLPEFIREARNHVAHFGFNENDFPSQEKLKKYLKEIVDMSPDELFEEHVKRKSSSVQAVLSPLGTSKGALFTVLKHFNPRVLVVMTSKLGAKNLPEILQKAGFSGECQVILVNDPFTGVDEVDRVVTEAEKCLQDIQKVVINLTGGTSLLGYMVERVRDRVRYGRQIDSVLAVDRRSYKEQEKNPYVVGEILKLPGM
ncbi:MAG: CRISPR-associated protein, partial [Thermotogae bacterium]